MASYAFAPADIPQSEWRKGQEAMRRLQRGMAFQASEWGAQALEDLAKFKAKLFYRPEATDEIQSLENSIVALARKAHYYWLGGLVHQAREADLSLRRARRRAA